MAYVEWKPDRVNTVAISWPRRLPRFPPSPTPPLGYDHCRPLGHCVLDALIDQKTNPTNQLKRKVDAVVGGRTDMDAGRQEAATHNLWQHMRYLTLAVREASRTKGHEKQFCNAM